MTKDKNWDQQRTTGIDQGREFKDKQRESMSDQSDQTQGQTQQGDQNKKPDDTTSKLKEHGQDRERSERRDR